jgi:hypothetical protein
MHRKQDNQQRTRGHHWKAASPLLFYISYFNKYFSQQRDSLAKKKNKIETEGDANGKS